MPASSHDGRRRDRTPRQLTATEQHRRQAVLRRVERYTRRIRRAEQEVERLFRERRAALLQGADLEVRQADLAAAAECNESAVSQQLRKARAEAGDG